MNVLLYQPPGAYSSLSSLLTIFYHNTCAVFICQDTNTNSAICTFLSPCLQLGLTRITNSAIVNLQTLINNPELCHELLELILGYIIFICPFDEFKLGLHKYTFQNRCNEQPELVLGDESTKIFLCAGGDANDVSDDMKEFLEWLTTGKTGQCELVNNLDHAIQKARDHEEWRLEYMTLLMRDQEMMKKGREEGRLYEIFSSVQEGDYSIVRGAQKAEMTIEQFEKAMTEAGYKLPANS